MSIFKEIFHSRDKPTNRTPGSSYSFLFGGSAAGKAVNERSAMQMTAVYSCVRILAEAVAGLPLHLYKYGEEGSKVKALDHQLYRLLHDEPNPEMSSFVFRETLMTHLLLWGNAYAQIIRNGKGEVIALYPLMPNKMTVDRDAGGNLYYRYQHSMDEAKTMDNSSVVLSPSEVMHIPGLGFDGLVGYSPIAMAKNAIGLAIAAEEYGSKFYANGAAPSGVLEHPGTLKDPSKVRDSWNSAFGGSANSNKVAVLEEGLKYTPISISPNEAQFLETRKFQIDEIARIFRVPPHMVGDLDKSSFSNIEHQSLEFVKYTLDPWVIRWEQSMSRALFNEDEKKEYFFKFNVDGLLRGSYQERMQGYATGIQNGFLSPNDVRELENMDRIPAEDGGDLYLTNGSLCPLSMAGAAYMKNKRFWNWINQAPEEGAPDERVLEIYGTIAEESWFEDDVTPKMFRDELFSGEGDVVIWLNSPGGDCIAASQIYSMLMDYKGSVTVKIDGLAASAASVIAMAGTRVLMAPTAMMLIHNPSTIAFGDHQDMQKVIEMLDEVKESIINAYEIKTDLSHTVLSHMMDEETWMNAKKAVELGFADGILEDAKKCTREEKSYSYSASSIDEAIRNKAVAKAKAEARVKAETEAKVKAEAEAKSKAEAKAEEKVMVEVVEEKPMGRSVETLMDRLNLLKY